MQYTTTISQKGQIVVPKEIRDKLNIKPSDTLKVRLENENIVVEPISPISAFLGMFKVEKPVTKKDIKKAYNDSVLKKFK